MIQNIQHPRKECVPLAVGLAWGNDGNESGFWTQEKLDGKFSAPTWRGNVLAGELMPTGNFIVWDVLALADVGDIRWKPLRERLTALAVMADALRADGIDIVQSASFADAGHAGNFLARVLARGGEGVVRKSLAATYYDTMTACKRLQAWRCVVTALNHATGGASIAEPLADGSLQDRGTVPLRNRAAHCRVGSVVKVEGETLSARGMILKPRPCKDTETSWLIQF